MQEALSTTTAAETFASLEQILAEETQALVRMDAEGVQAIAQRKLEICEALTAKPERFAQLDRSQLDKLRLRLRHNLILLAHAREHVQGTVNILTGRLSTLGPHRPADASPARLNLRG